MFGFYISLYKYSNTEFRVTVTIININVTNVLIIIIYYAYLLQLRYWFDCKFIRNIPLNTRSCNILSENNTFHGTRLVLYFVIKSVKICEKREHSIGDLSSFNVVVFNKTHLGEPISSKILIQKFKLNFRSQVVIRSK